MIDLTYKCRYEVDDPNATTSGWFNAGDDGFGVAQSLLNVPEVLMQLIALYLHWYSKQSTLPVILTLIAQTCTFWKTVLYFVVEIVEGSPNTWHSSSFDYYVLFLLPNSLWLISISRYNSLCFYSMSSECKKQAGLIVSYG